MTFNDLTREEKAFVLQVYGNVAMENPDITLAIVTQCFMDRKMKQKYAEASQKLGITPEKVVEDVKNRGDLFVHNSFGDRHCGCALTQIAVTKNPDLNPYFGRGTDLKECREVLGLSVHECWMVAHGFDKSMNVETNASPYFHYGLRIRELAEQENLMEQ